MIFLYNALAGDDEIIITKNDDNFVYLSKVKRSAVGEKIAMSNLSDTHLYQYIFFEITKQKIVFKKEIILPTLSVLNPRSLHLLWGICDPKIILKTIPFLNEIGVFSITFVLCERSQGNYIKTVSEIKTHGKFFDKIQKVLEQSCQQCGRNSRMSVSIGTFNESVERIQKNERKPSLVCDFPSEKKMDTMTGEELTNIENVFIGPEGGFSQEEKKVLQQKIPKNIFQFSGNNVLRSETAVIGISGKILL